MDPKVLDRIRKLFRLARDQAGAPEGELALRKAMQACDRFRLDPRQFEEEAGEHQLPLIEVALGGREDERHREQYRPAVLSVLAEAAGFSASYNPTRWVGRLFGAMGEGPQARVVTDLYQDLEAYLDTAFHKYWIPRRFGSTPRHWHRQMWWVSAARALRDILRPLVEMTTVPPGHSIMQLRALRALQRAPEELLARILALSERSVHPRGVVPLLEEK